jgi:hypothetical protein
MKSINQFKIVFLFSLTLVFLQYVIKYSNLPGGNVLMLINLPFIVTYIVMALKEIYGSNKVNLIEKIMWTICLIGLNWFAGLIYLLFARKRVLRKYKVLFNDTGAFA